MTPTTDVGHPVDGELIRYLDQELPDAERERVGRHLHDCPRCRARLDDYRAINRRLRAGLRVEDERSPAGGTLPPPSPTSAPPMAGHALRRAAMVLLTAAALGAATAHRPLRAWIVDRWTALTTPTMVPPTPTPDPLATPSTAGVRFAPEVDSLRVRLINTQRVGRLEMIVHPGTDVHVTVVGGGDETVTIVPGGLSILNAPDSRATYRLEVPGRIRFVTLRIGSGPPIRWEWGPGASPRTIDLTPPSDHP